MHAECLGISDKNFRFCNKSVMNLLFCLSDFDTPGATEIVSCVTLTYLPARGVSTPCVPDLCDCGDEMENNLYVQGDAACSNICMCIYLCAGIQLRKAA